MKTLFLASLDKDLGKLRDRQAAQRLEEIIDEIQAAGSIHELHQVKKLSGFKDCYRIKIGNYRFGFRLVDGVVCGIHFRHRKDIYRVFP